MYAFARKLQKKCENRLPIIILPWTIKYLSDFKYNPLTDYFRDKVVDIEHRLQSTL